jgi:hypothetical protein
MPELKRWRRLATRDKEKGNCATSARRSWRFVRQLLFSTRAFGATLEALIAAFCRLNKSLSCW